MKQIPFFEGKFMRSNQKPRSPRWGYFYVMLAAFLWAVSGSSAKFLFNGGITPFQLVQLRVTLATAFVFLLLICVRKSLPKIAREDIAYFVVLGVVGIAGVQSTYLFAISKINVAAAILLQYMAPIFIALFSVFVARERLKGSTIAAIAMAVSGCYLVVGAYNFDNLSMNRAGIASGLASAVCFAWYSVHGEYGMRKYNPWVVLFFALLFGAAVWNVLHPPLEAFMHPYSIMEWGWIFYIGVFGTAVPFGLFLEGIDLIRSARASITGTLEPIAAGALSYAFLNETMEPLQLAGGILVLSAVVLLQIKQEIDDKAPALIRAGTNREKEEKKNAR